jgi:hypothetical protein
MLSTLQRPYDLLSLRSSPLRDGLRVSLDRWRGRLGGLVLVTGLGVAGPAVAITGVCPDGSVFIVQRASEIPCRAARRVEPHQVPPMRPENLPRSYLWEVYHQQQSENNPYNLVDRAEKIRKGLAHAGNGTPPPPPPAPTETAPAPGGHPLPQVASAPPPSAPAPRPPARAELGLTDGELHDLFVLVELSQNQAPATFALEAAGKEAMRVSFAHSRAFEARLRSAESVDGPVVLFSVQPKQREMFRPNFTFVQGQTAYRPQPGDAHQLDLLVGRMGELGPDELVLGYAVLPSAIDLARPVDVYWDDRRIAVQFR